jgi:hypothetical protein
MYVGKVFLIYEWHPRMFDSTILRSPAVKISLIFMYDKKNLKYI